MMPAVAPKKKEEEEVEELLERENMMSLLHRLAIEVASWGHRGQASVQRDQASHALKNKISVKHKVSSGGILNCHPSKRAPTLVHPPEHSSSDGHPTVCARSPLGGNPRTSIGHGPDHCTLLLRRRRPPHSRHRH